MRSFQQAWQTGDLASLIGLLDPDVTAIVDGGGIVSAAHDPLFGAESVSRFFLEVFTRQPDLTVHEEQVNGEPGLVARDHSATILAVIVLNISSSGKVRNAWAIRNPDKLGVWS